MKRTSMLVSAVIFSLAAAMAASNQTFTVSFILGSAALRPAAENQWEPLFIGDEIQVGDSLSIPAESRVELVDAGMRRVAVGEGFKNTFSKATVPALAALATGSSAFSTLLNSRSDMKVTSPVAVAAVRGKSAADTGENEDTEAVLDAETQAQMLLDEALNLRSQVDRMIETNNTEAAMAAMDQSRQLADQALQILESAGITD